MFLVEHRLVGWDLFLDSSNFRVSHIYKESYQVTNKIADMGVSLNSATWLVLSSRCLCVLINRHGMMPCYWFKN